MALGIALGIARAGVGAFQMMQGNAMATQGMRDAARFGQQIANTRFVNKFAALQAPTKGARLAMQNISRAAQMGVQAAQEGGLRGVIGGAGRIESAVGDKAAKIAAQLDNLQLQIDNKFLTEEQKTDLRNKQKDLGLAYERLKGAQAAQTAGGTMTSSGLGQVVSGLGQTIGGLVERSDLYKEKNDGLSRRQQRKMEKQRQQDGITSGGAMEQARMEAGITGAEGTGAGLMESILTEETPPLKTLDEPVVPQLEIDDSYFNDPILNTNTSPFAPPVGPMSSQALDQKMRQGFQVPGLTVPDPFADPFYNDPTLTGNIQETP